MVTGITVKTKDDLAVFEGRAMQRVAGVDVIIDIENDLSELPTLIFERPDRTNVTIVTTAQNPASGDGLFTATAPAGFLDEQRGGWKVQAKYVYTTPAGKIRHSQVKKFEVEEVLNA
jgi:hypothetical protein